MCTPVGQGSGWQQCLSSVMLGFIAADGLGSGEDPELEEPDQR